MKVSDVIAKLSSFDGELPVIIGGDGAYLGEVEGVFLDEVRGETKAIIAEWDVDNKQEVKRNGSNTNST